jgi:hypothetical protein
LASIKNPLSSEVTEKKKATELVNKQETIRFKELCKEYKVMLDIDNSDEEFEEEMR